jgi:hypothetical protein
MNKLLQTTAAVLLLPLFLQAKVIESSVYADILPYMDSQTLLVTDLDNTVIKPNQVIGSDQWGSSITARLKAAGVPEDLAIDAGVSMFAVVQMKTEVSLVEASTANVLRQAQQRGARLLGLTARPLYLINRTMSELQSVGFPKNEHRSFDVVPGAKYRDGIIFIGPHLKKGEVLKQVLASNSDLKNIRRVVFIDDKVHHAEGVDAALAGSRYDVISIRYGAADAWVKSFDPVQADLEWKRFNEVGL